MSFAVIDRHSQTYIPSRLCCAGMVAPYKIAIHTNLLVLRIHLSRGRLKETFLRITALPLTRGETQTAFTLIAIEILVVELS